MYMRLVHLWGARAKHAVIMRLPSSTLPRRAAYLSDGPTHGYHAWPPLGPKRAVCALLKTCNQLIHWLPLALLAPVIRAATIVPRCNLSTPSMTTTSPGARPCSMATASPSLGPTTT